MAKLIAESRVLSLNSFDAWLWKVPSCALRLFFSFCLAECCFVVWPLHFTSVKRNSFPEQAGELFNQRTVTMLQSCSQLSPAFARATHVPSSYCYQDSAICMFAVLSHRTCSLLKVNPSPFLLLQCRHTSF